MAGLEDLIAAMSIGEKQKAAISADDPYAPFSALGSDTMKLSLSTPGLSTRDRIIGSILGGLGSGLAQGFSSDYQGRAMNAYQDVLAASKAGNEIEAPSVLPRSVFESAQQQGSIMKMLQEDAAKVEAAKAEAALGVETRKAANDLLISIAKAKADKPWMAAEIDRVIGSPKAQAAEPITESPKASEADALRYMSPVERLKYYDEKNARDQDLQLKKEKNASDAKAGIVDTSIKLRKEFQDLPAFTDYQTANKGYNAMLKAIDDPSGTSDVDLVKGGIQMIEPGLSVNQGEAGALAGTASIPAWMKAQIAGALGGESRLSEATRKGIVELAKRRYDEHAKAFNAARNYYTPQIKGMNLPDDQITYLDQALTAEEIQNRYNASKLNAGGIPGGGQTVMGAGGKQYRVDETTKTLIPIN
jgi:hypothetical protein